MAWVLWCVWCWVFFFEGRVCTCKQNRVKKCCFFLSSARPLISFKYIKIKNFIRRKRASVEQRVKFTMMP